MSLSRICRISRVLLAALAAAFLFAVPAQARLHLPRPLPPVAHNPANALLGDPIEPLTYDPGTHCDPSVKPGIDWHLSVHSTADRRAAAKLVLLLLAPDRDGNPQALARRMGVEELIWDCGYWSMGMAAFEPYRDHIHIGMTKAGAHARTSFWRDAR